MNAITYYSEAIKKVDKGEITIGEYERMIKVLRDVEPVVRCRECKHYEWTGNRVPEEQTWWCYKHNTEMGNNDYCSYGERKDGEHEQTGGDSMGKN